MDYILGFESSIQIYNKKKENSQFFLSQINDSLQMLILYRLPRNRDSAVGVATSYELDDPLIRGLNRDQVKNVLFSRHADRYWSPTRIL
jgi:hypothetical protein